VDSDAVHLPILAYVILGIIKLSMTIYCIGNVLLDTDNLPLRVMDRVRVKFPEHTFQEADPSENFFPEEGSVIIDTVVGTHDVTLFTTLEAFTPAPRVSVHDYDLSFHLRFLEKLGKLPSIKIIGIPQDMDEDNAQKGVSKILRSLS
jgi:Ni,Fe-hydrogenase maturation factor